MTYVSVDSSTFACLLKVNKLLVCSIWVSVLPTKNSILIFCPYPPSFVSVPHSCSFVFSSPPPPVSISSVSYFIDSPQQMDDVSNLLFSASRYTLPEFHFIFLQVVIKLSILAPQHQEQLSTERFIYQFSDKTHLQPFYNQFIFKNLAAVD